MKLDQAQIKKQLRIVGKQVKPDNKYLIVSRNSFLQEVQREQPSTPLPNYQYKFIIATTIVLTILVGIKTTSPIINDAKPGELIYLLDRTYESVQVEFIKDSDNRRQFYINQTIERLEELDELEKAELMDDQSMKEFKQLLIQDIENTISKPEVHISTEIVETFNQSVKEGFDAQNRVYFRSLLEENSATQKDINQENDSDNDINVESIRLPIVPKVTPITIPISGTSSPTPTVSQSVNTQSLTETTSTSNTAHQDILDQGSGASDFDTNNPELTSQSTPPDGDQSSTEVF